MAIAKRYAGNPNAQNYLANKVIAGGSGNWEVEMAMPAHPTISQEDVNSIVKYILSLNDENSEKPLAVKGSFIADPSKDNLHDSYIFRASYTDNGGASTPEQLSTKMLVLRNPEIPVVNFDDFIDIEINHSIRPDFSDILPKDNGAALVLEKADLSGIREILFSASEKSAKKKSLDWKIEVRIDSIEGKLIGETEENDKGEIRVKISPITDYHDVYLVFVKKEPGSKDSSDIHIRRVRFGR
jgi:cytochrome c